MRFWQQTKSRSLICLESFWTMRFGSWRAFRSSRSILEHDCALQSSGCGISCTLVVMRRESWKCRPLTDHGFTGLTRISLSWTRPGHILQKEFREQFHFYHWTPESVQWRYEWGQILAFQTLFLWPKKGFLKTSFSQIIRGTTWIICTSANLTGI